MEFKRASDGRCEAVRGPQCGVAGEAEGRAKQKPHPGIRRTGVLHLEQDGALLNFRPQIRESHFSQNAASRCPSVSGQRCIPDVLQVVIAENKTPPACGGWGSLQLHQPASMPVIKLSPTIQETHFSQNEITLLTPSGHVRPQTFPLLSSLAGTVSPRPAMSNTSRW